MIGEFNCLSYWLLTLSSSPGTYTSLANWCDCLHFLHVVLNTGPNAGASHHGESNQNSIHTKVKASLT